MIHDRRQPFFRLLPTTAIPALIFFLAFCWQLKNQTPLKDQDTGWHIRAGEWILKHRSIPAHDPWSHTAGDAPWYNLSWLFDAALGLLHQAGGLPLLYLVTLIAYACIAAILAQQAVNRGAGFLPIIVIFPFCVLTVITQVALCRPNLISSLFLLAFMHLLACDRNDPSWRRLAWLPVMMVLWVNMHGGFLIVPILFAVHLAEAVWERDKARIKRLFLTGVFTALAILANPYGYHIYDGVMRTMDSAITDSILEWQPVNFKRDVHYLLFLLLFIFAFRPHAGTATLAEKLFMLIALVLALTSVRHGMILVIASAPILTANLSRLLEETPLGERFRAKEVDFMQDMRKPRARKGMLILCIAAMLAVITPATARFIAPHSDTLNLGKTPRRAIAFIENNYPEIRWMNEYSTGGLLIYYGAPKNALFIDGRAGTAYAENIIRDDLAFSESWGYGKKARRIIERYTINGLIMPTEARISRYLRTHPTWKRVYRDRYLSLFIRKSFTSEP